MKESVDLSSPPFYPLQRSQKNLFKKHNTRDSDPLIASPIFGGKRLIVNNVQGVEDLEEGAKNSCCCLDFERVHFVGRLFVGKSKLCVCLAILQQLRLISEKHYPIAIVLDGRQLALLDRS